MKVKVLVQKRLWTAACLLSRKTQGQKKSPPKKHPGGYMGISSPIRTMKEILQSFGKSDGETKETKVLDPEHPLMLRYQKDLKERLLKLHEETDKQMNELNGAINDQTKGNDGLGKRICTLQKDLLQQKEILGKMNDDYNDLCLQKIDVEKKLNNVKKSYKSQDGALKQEKNKEVQLQNQMEQLALEVVQLTSLQLNSYADTSTMKSAVEKTNKQRQDLELEKLRQDLLISRLEEDKHSLEDKIHLYKSQCAIKKEELTDLRKVLIEAIADIQTIHYEKLQLMQQWNYSISSLEKRDQTSAVMRESVRLCEDDMRTLNMDIVNQKKSIRKELETNEKLTHQLQYRESDVAQLQKTIEDSKSRQLNLQQQYSFFDHTVFQTDRALDHLNNEKKGQQKELDAKGRQLEKSCFIQREMDAKYMEILHEKMTITKASHCTEKLIEDRKKKIEQLETKCALKEGEEAKLHLKIKDVESHLQSMEEILTDIRKVLQEKEKTIARSEGEIAKGHSIIEKKQIAIAELNRKLDILISNAGGMELGPMEREISNFKKEIAVAEEKRSGMEQEWLRLQLELVTLTNEASSRFKDIDLYYKRASVLEEKKIRLEADISKEEKEIKDLTRSIEHMQVDVLRLATLLVQEKGLEERLQQDTQLLKGDYVGALKEAELEYVKKQDEVDYMKKKRGRLLCKLIDSQRQVIFWDGKLHLAEETRKILKSETHAEEVANFKSESRRLEVRWEQIIKEQESFIQRMQKAAMQHADLYVKADIQSIRGIKKPSAQYLATKSERLKRKINEDKKELEYCKEQIKLNKEKDSNLESKREEEQSGVLSVVQHINYLKNDTEKKLREKWQNVIRLSFKHKRNKYLQQIKEEKYVRAFRNEDMRPREIEKLRCSIKVIQDITEWTMSSHPELAETLLKVLDHTAVVGNL